MGFWGAIGSGRFEAMCSARLIFATGLFLNDDGIVWAHICLTGPREIFRAENIVG